MNPKLSRTRAAALGAATLVGAALLAMPASAQPAGNPKGTVTPSTQGEAGRSPATSAPPVGVGGSGALTSDQGPASARMNKTPPPGGGTAGGLTKRNPQDTDPHRRDTMPGGTSSQKPVPASPR